jgi:hypothetical protein
LFSLATGAISWGNGSMGLASKSFLRNQVKMSKLRKPPYSVVAAFAVVAASFKMPAWSPKMPAWPPVLKALVFIWFHMSLMVWIIIVAMGIRVIGIVVIG